MSSAQALNQNEDNSDALVLVAQPISSDSQYSHWDYYATKVRPKENFWPGDEWGTETSWNFVFRRLFVPSGVTEWRRCLEIGPGAGKYSIKVLRESQAELIAADISAVYQSHFRARIEHEGLSERVTPVLITNNSNTILRHIESKGWVGTLDAFYSIDAMVHVDLQYVIAYLVTAAYSLREGGKLIMTVSNPCSKLGFEKLISDTKRMFRRIHTHSAKFEWMSPDQLTSILPRLGFEIDVLDTNGRDILFVATLKKRLDDESILSCVK